jgi:hypothetical protein
MAKKKSVTTVDDLVFDAANVRVHTDKNKKAIRNSVKQFKAGRSILVDAENVIRAGNGTAEAWKETGGKVRVIETDGNELIAVKRTDLKGAEAIAYAIADNRAAELAEWDHEQLEAIVGDLSDEMVEAVGFEAEDLNNMLAVDSESGISEFENSFQQDKDSFEGNEIKQITFHFVESDMLLVTSFLELKKAELELETFSEVLVAIANEANQD